MEEPNFDVIIPVKASDLIYLESLIPYINKNIAPRNIIVITGNSKNNNLDKLGENVFIRNEDKIFPKISYNIVKEKISELDLDPSTTGWYYQQFIKLMYSTICQDDYYLVWDADTFPLRKLNFFDGEKVILTTKREFHNYYFLTLKLLLGINKKIDDSFIAEHMMINKHLCKDFLNKINDNKKLPGNSFWEKILYASSKQTSKMAFSEFESLGTYLYINHKDMINIRHLNTLRPGKLYLGEFPNAKEWDWAAQSFDIVSIEHSDKGKGYKYSSFICKYLFRRYPFDIAILKTNRFVSLLSELKIKRFIKLKKQLEERKEFDFFFCKTPLYTEKNTRN